jgi:hypothetical protein
MNSHILNARNKNEKGIHDSYFSDGHPYTFGVFSKTELESWALCVCGSVPVPVPRVEPSDW